MTQVNVSSPIFTKERHPFPKIDYIFTSSDEYFSPSTHITSLSDHRIIQISPSSPPDRRQSYWKLNDNIIKHNKEYILSTLQFFSTSPLDYDFNKADMTDQLRMLCINKRRTDKATEENIRCTMKQLFADSMKVTVTKPNQLLSTLVY